MSNDVVHDVDRLADAQAADCIALKSDIHGVARALLPERWKDASLHDPELRLTSIGDDDAINLALSQLLHARPRSSRPASSPHRRGSGGVERRGMGQTLVEHHRNVRSQLRLNVSGLFRREEMRRAVEVRLKLGAILRDLPALSQAEDLIAATVSQDWFTPTDKFVEAATPGHQIVAGPQIQMVGVAQQNFGADSVELLVRRTL